MYVTGGGGPPRLLAQQQQQQQQQGAQQQQQPVRTPQNIAGRVNSPRFVTESTSGGIGSPYGAGFPQPGTPVLEGRSGTPTNQFIFDTRSLQQQQPQQQSQQQAQQQQAISVKERLGRMVASRTQQQQQQLQHSQQQPQQQHSQQQQQQLARVDNSSSQSLTEADLEALGLSLELSEATGIGIGVGHGAQGTGQLTAANCAPGSPLFGAMFADLGPSVSSPRSLASPAGGLSRSSLQSPRMVSGPPASRPFSNEILFSP